MDHEEYKRKALEPIVNYIESVMASYSKEEIEARIKKALPEKESEDERIRKHLIEIVETYWGKTNDPGKAADLAYLEKQKEQKPAEWSEEDEFFRQQLIVYCDNCVQDSLAAKCVAWLKSLHPQSHWKPSEHQLEVLKLVAEKDGTCLMGLYNELKTL